MVDIKRFVVVGAAVFSAVGIGFVMQSRNTVDQRYEQVAVPSLTGTPADPLTVTDITLTSAVAEPEQPASTQAAPVEEKPVQEDMRVAALETESVIDALPQELNPDVTCEISMTAEPMPAAMADVTLSAPCLPNERVTLHHNGMMFTDVTDASGELQVDVPALTKNAIFIAAFANGEGALASATITGLEQIDRKVVQSKVHGQLQISAFEFGADFRQDGHVTTKANRSMADVEAGNGGFMTRLGDETVGASLVAEIYTFPTNASKTAGDVAVIVEAEVTTDNCGLRIEAQTLEVSQGGRLKVQDLTLPIPACDAVGDFLVLQNLLGDLKVARN